ncbi:universal stress protein [Pareuzebyella sediminis]|uniref:universal stress protein n=1 Tax=Pareuzebyella sediminis TaxID=2607998 RepID=UPI0011EC6FBD|nr:universal stress protein [Pareuzebyella sediminis]
MQQILIPTDFSENAWNAIKYGLELLKENRCTFYLLHVNPIPSYSGAGTSVKAASENFKDTLLKGSRKQIEELIVKIKALPFNTEHTFVALAIYDYFTDAVKRELETKKIDLIIMGTKGASGLKKVTVGSNTGDVITKIKHPLLAVPENAQYSSPKQIAFATDYHIGYDINVLNTLLKMAALKDATIQILHLCKNGENLTEEQQRNKDFLDDYLVGINHSFHLVTGPKLAHALEAFTEMHHINLIAMVAKNLNLFQRILFRPLVEEISYSTKVPFLVLHE